VLRRPHLTVTLVLLLWAHTAVTAPARADDDAAPTSKPRATESPRLTTPIVHALALMTAMRVSEAYLWPTPFAETKPLTIALHYNQAYSRPPLWDSGRPLFEEDGDRWQINVVGHALFGSELYLRARTCRLPLWQALLFTGLASATWEYGIEASGVRPSALDLTFTPVAGLVLGETRFVAWRAARRLEPGPLRSTLSALVDPLGDLERALGTPC
jgi:Domain of unknown function (DUF3943)